MDILTVYIQGTLTVSQNSTEQSVSVFVIMWLSKHSVPVKKCNTVIAANSGRGVVRHICLCMYYHNYACYILCCLYICCVVSASMYCCRALRRPTGSLKKRRRVKLCMPCNGVLLIVVGCVSQFAELAVYIHQSLQSHEVQYACIYCAIPIMPVFISTLLDSF